MKNKKDVGVIIKFDDKKYSKEEIIYFYQRFFTILAEAKNIKISKNTGKILYDCILDINRDH